MKRNRARTVLLNTDRLLQIYKETQSTRKTAERLGTNHTTVRDRLHELGVCNKQIRYTCDHTFFSRDTEESFYWAGFLAADGTISERGKNRVPTTVRLCLSVKDAGHIENFAKSVNFNGVIEYDDLSCGELRYYGLGITSRQMCIDLGERFNVVPRKTKIYTFPQWLMDHPLVHHFMRGYFDGDGSFYWGGMWRSDGHTRSVKQVKFNLRGNNDFLNDYREILFRNCEVTMNPPRMNCGTPMIECGGNGVLSKICRFLYKDATIYLPRKKEYADYAISYRDEKEEKIHQDACLEFQRKSSRWHHTCHIELTKKNLERLYAEYKFIPDLASVLHLRDTNAKQLLIDNGIPIIDRSNKYYFTKEQLIELCKKHQSSYGIAMELGCTCGCIQNNLIKFGINILDFKTDKYDYKFFAEEKPSEKQFYLAGYLLGNSMIDIGSMPS